MLRLLSSLASLTRRASPRDSLLPAPYQATSSSNPKPVSGRAHLRDVSDRCVVIAAVAAFGAALLGFIGHVPAEGLRLVQREAEFVALVAAGFVARGVRIVIELVERLAGAACRPEDERCDHGENGSLGNVLTPGRRSARCG